MRMNYRHSQATKDKIGKANKGHFHSAETRLKISHNRKGKPSKSNPNGIVRQKGRIFIRTRDHKYTRLSHIVMENHIGRPIEFPEQVHHINHVKDDDRIENLMLFKNNSIHMKSHYPTGSHFGIHTKSRNA